MFLNEFMFTKGRRTDLNGNAFWAAAAALVPEGVFKDRQGRAVMQLLDQRYQVGFFCCSSFAPRLSLPPPSALVFLQPPLCVPR